MGVREHLGASAVFLESMRKELAALSRETLIYGASTVVGRFLNFLLVPFYVNVLHSTSEYGISSVLYTWIAFLNVIYPLGLEGAYFRYASRGENETSIGANESRLFSGSFNLILVFGAFLSLVFYFIAPTIAPTLFYDPKTNISEMLPMLIRITRYSALILLFDGLSVLPFADLRLEHQAKKFAGIKLTTICLTLILNFVLILGFHFGVEGIFVANLIASAVQLMLLTPVIVRKYGFRVSGIGFRKSAPLTPNTQHLTPTRYPRKMLTFGLTNVPAYLGAMMVQVIDRPIVQVYLGLGAVGVYQANYRMGFIMMVFVSLFEYAWRPFFMRQHKTDDARARELFSRVFTYFMLVALVAFLLLSFFLPYILSTPVFGRRLLRADYLSGMSIIPVVLFAYIFQGAYTNFIAGIYIKERNKTLPFITGLGALVNVVVNLALIPILGIMGAALATLAAYIAMAIAIYIPSQKAYPIKYEWKRVALAASVVLSTYTIERILVAGGIVSGGVIIFAIRIILSLAAIGALFAFGFFSGRERAFIRETIGRLRFK
ncbi:MAG TPA: oligosaccharide flippase family protein [Candidatus Kapabacteria bacterium]|nr:oligosaccharide flippase family protein [Candidatus Kapabacteria bacterium]